MAAAMQGDRTPLLLAEEGGLRQRASQQSEAAERYKPGKDWDSSLPYGGKVYLARKKKPDPTWVRVLEALAIIGTIAFALYAYFYFDRLHFHVTHGYAHLGYPTAQHQVGQRLLHGVGTDKDQHKAMEWFKLSADQGHAHASYNLAVGHLKGYTKLNRGIASDQGHAQAHYNLAVGHLKGYRTDLVQPGEAHRLIHHAAAKGVKEAHRVLNEVCAKGGCD